MSLTFEEMADAGLKDLPSSTKSKQRTHTKLLFLTILCALCAFALYQRFKTVHEEKPIAAKILLAEVSNTEDVLPHVEDNATEFEGALPFLKRIAEAPDYRETEHGKNVDALVTVETTEAETASIQIDQSQYIEVEFEPLLTKTINSELTIQSQGSATLPVDEPQTALEAAPIDLPQDIVIKPFQVVSDWSGIVLVPENHVLAKAYNSDVRLLRIEAHPIDGDYIRVWTRIENRTETMIETEVGCEFRGRNNRLESPSFAQVSLPPRGVIDAYFVSRNPEVHSYTVLVKR